VHQTKRKILAALLGVTLATFSMGAEGCPKEGTPTPRPNPDTGPGGARNTPNPNRTPRGPVPTDPGPEEEREYEWQVFITWSPTKLFVQIDWDPNGPLVKPQRAGGTYTSTKKKVKGTGRTIWAEAEWTDLSQRRMTTPDSSIKCVLVVDGRAVDEDTDIGVDALAHCEWLTGA
jgi:hypothetical protein